MNESENQFFIHDHYEVLLKLSDDIHIYICHHSDACLLTSDNVLHFE